MIYNDVGYVLAGRSVVSKGGHGVIWTRVAYPDPPAELYASAPPARAVPAGIGDVNSTEKGSGARYNSGKPDLSLVPLTLIADYFDKARDRYDPEQVNAVDALRELGQYQQTQDIEHLHRALFVLGDEGWNECAHVFSYGKIKYAAWNWAKGMPWSAPLSSGARHLLAIITRKDRADQDPESNQPHRGHFFCNVVMLLHYHQTYPTGNDLPPIGTL